MSLLTLSSHILSVRLRISPCSFRGWGHGMALWSSKASFLMRSLRVTYAFLTRSLRGLCKHFRVVQRLILRRIGMVSMVNKNNYRMIYVFNITRPCACPYATSFQKKPYALLRNSGLCLRKRSIRPNLYLAFLLRFFEWLNSVYLRSLTGLTFGCHRCCVCGAHFRRVPLREVRLPQFDVTWSRLRGKS